jgi:hypothetical protein
VEAGPTNRVGPHTSRNRPAFAEPGRRACYDLAGGLIDKALQTRFGDQSLRYAYPLASWVVEQSSDPTQGMVTLRTVDGFSVCFSIPREQQSELGEALGPARAEGDDAN